MPEKNLISRIEDYITQYVTLMEPKASLPIALWIVATHCYLAFDAFPYLVITSPTKQSGKTRLMEIVGFSAANPETLPAASASQIYHAVNDKFPTLLIDEAESLASEAASDQRVILNVGYRRGSKKKLVLGGELVEFDTYCPKVFVLIGDVYDTLRDRSINLIMQRAEPKRRFLYMTAQGEGTGLAEEVKTALGKFETAEGPRFHDTDLMRAINNGYADFKGLPFLRDRDEEIWTPLFVICEAMCPERLADLTAVAVDMSAAKTGEARKYYSSKVDETKMEDDHYAKQLLADMVIIMEEEKKRPAQKQANGHVLIAISGDDAIARLKAIPASPWRTYKGIGLTRHAMAALLGRFGIQTKTIRYAKTVKAATKGAGGEAFRGFDYDSITRAKKFIENPGK